MRRRHEEEGRRTAKRGDLVGGVALETRVRKETSERVEKLAQIPSKQKTSSALSCITWLVLVAVKRKKIRRK
ncbi:hypothetical protein AGOR_G00071680 [Albula goreensis]|uniref:Uncharacterized protein n=1 Tax=Albula goreensis TaxID=1534307 RepID=A0A8T3DR18_9TELE|nr:hypothetical protein AGOR_G00071680 [Albula goreensis]